MIELVRPTTDLATSWWHLVDSFAGEPIHGSGYRHADRGTLADPAAFEEWTTWLARQEVAGDHIGPGRVPAAYRWILEDGQVVGTITVRLELNELLAQSGGHIAYAVQPPSRRRGVASGALALALQLAARRGIDRVLITCEDDNLASMLTILRAGGVPAGSGGGLRRYWVITGDGPAPE